MPLNLSVIIPVYNRPQEVLELLQSFREQTYQEPYEIVIVEDGSSDTAASVVEDFSDLNITYCPKQNTGPGDSRNYGMKRAKGSYFLILDSDCVLPNEYLEIVSSKLNAEFSDFFGGPDAAQEDFSPLQKAINYVMTSLITTGGIRGRKEAKANFEPRSFNMGLSKEAFEASGGFGTIHPGEDPDLSIRLWDLGFKSRLIPEAFVYHKRRISWSKFYKQVQKFGLVRPILNRWHPQTAKLTFWFPTLFTLVLIAAFVAAMLQWYLPVFLVLFYCLLVGVGSAIKNRNVLIGFLSIWAVLVQFVGYGLAFIESKVQIGWLKKDPRKVYPHLFFE